jgi:acetyl-CoA acetyltransferase
VQYPRGAVAVVGVGATAQGELAGRSADEIAVDAFRLALDDAGLGKQAIDGLITCRSVVGHGIDTDIGKLAGLNPRYSATLDYGTCNFSLHLAAMAITSGLCHTVAMLYGTNPRTNRIDFGRPAPGSDFSAPYGYLHVAGPAAMAFRRHQHLYGTTEEQLGHIAVAQREHALLNPLAVFREPLSIHDYLAAPYLVAPLRRPDVTMISDGGAAVIVTAADRAAHFAKRPAYLLGMAEQTALRELENDDNLMRPWIGDVASRVYTAAGVAPADIDALYIQDPTSVWVLQMLEWYGFCGIGEGGPFIAEGHTRLGGSIPVNTNGGQLSESYMWGWLHLVEAVRQLRGECGPRQVPGARLVQHCSTKTFQKAASSILATQP